MSHSPLLLTENVHLPLETLQHGLIESLRPHLLLSNWVTAACGTAGKEILTISSECKPSYGNL